MSPPRKRLPGQDNAAYQRSIDPNASFLGTHSLHGGGDLSFVQRAVSALLVWLDRRRGRRSSD